MKINKALLISTISLGSITGAFAGNSTIVIDNFLDGSSFTAQNTSGTAAFNYLSSAPDIIGGSRQVRVRAGGSGFYGPSDIAVNTTAGTLSSYGGDDTDRSVQYGSAIGSQTQTGAGPGTPVNLNQDWAMGYAFDISVLNASSGDSMGITLFGSSGQQYSTSISITTAGNYTVPLSAFNGLTDTVANDIDGLLFSPGSTAGSASTGLVLNELAVTVPEPSTWALAGAGSLGMLMMFRRRK